jgi:hypothetical protein
MIAGETKIDTTNRAGTAYIGEYVGVALTDVEYRAF